TFKRYPEGVEKDFFFEKRCPGHRPAWVKTAAIAQDNGEPLTFCVVNDLETLIWAENLASIELHTPLAKAQAPNTPDAMIFDLDPGEGAGLPECSRVALILRDLLAGLGLASYGKTSGRKGLHVYVPLNRPETSFEDTRAFSRAVAEIMQNHYPKLVTAKMAKQERKAKVFINWSQNDAAKTMISVYSLRAREKPFVSFPVEWETVESVVNFGGAESLNVMHAEAVRRIMKKGDLFRDVLVKVQRLPHL
ncbi:MAG TPA: non-homologous end-joining DNA ligase, partial [Nitrospirota bacterium]